MYLFLRVAFVDFEDMEDLFLVLNWTDRPRTYQRRLRYQLQRLKPLTALTALTALADLILLRIRHRLPVRQSLISLWMQASPFPAQHRHHQADSQVRQ